VPDVYAVGAVDWDRKLFDELIPLPDGTSYNSYLIKGSEKTALLDTVDPAKVDVLIGNLVSSGVSSIDYVIAHHAEQDHSGCIGDVLLMYPGAKVVTNARCKDMLIDLLHIEEESFLVIEDGGELSLGNKTLKFINTPWVHWPETFCTYLKEDKVLFSCDFFGSHLASSDLFVKEHELVRDAAKRYYAEIMMPFRKPISKNLQKLGEFDIDMIAPSHGPVYDDPEFIIDAYKDWVSEDVKNEVVLAYVSMHESTRKMVDHFAASLIEMGITVKVFNLTDVDTGKLAIELVDAATVVIATPTVLAGAHPKAAYAALLASALRPKTKFISVIGSYGWGGKAVEQIIGLLGSIKAEVLDSVMVKGAPRDEHYELLDELASKILARHEEIGITG
jgi:flavorubredoxin